MPATRWGQCLGDSPLAALIARALTTASPPSVQAGLSAEIAGRYVALRAQQTALILLAEREDLDGRLVAIARQRLAAGAAPRQAVAAAEAQLSDTRADQARTRAQIAALRVRLAVLAGAALDTLDRLPGGPIPQPPAAPIAGGRDWAPAAYRAAAVAATAAQVEALRARAAATRQILDARKAGTMAPDEIINADRRALAALQAEQRARATVAQAYIALAKSQR